MDGLKIPPIDPLRCLLCQNPPAWFLVPYGSCVAVFGALCLVLCSLSEESLKKPLRPPRLNQAQGTKHSSSTFQLFSICPMSSPSPGPCILSPDRTSDAEVLVRVENVSKIFCRDFKKSLLYGLKDSAKDLVSCGKGRDRPPGGPTFPSSAGGSSSSSKILDPQSSILNPSTASRPLRPGEFYAVHDVSFELRRGECLGLIGRNGAGKTTLLKMLNGLIKPDAGRITMRGRVGALIALGAGFNPLLTGRENIYVNGSVLGLSKAEIDAKIVEIIDFAEIAEFIDSPVQTYSSGMQVRLGFAVATALNPDILILDEVLAVGDASFRNKCYKRIASIRKNAAIIFVSHNMEQVGRICDRVLMMNSGRNLYIGDVEGGILAYDTHNGVGEPEDPSFTSMQHPVIAFSCNPTSYEIETGSPVSFAMGIDSLMSLEPFHIRFHFYNQSGCFVADCIASSTDYGINLSTGTNSWELFIPYIPLKGGVYKISVQIIDKMGAMLVWSHKFCEIKISGKREMRIAECQLPVEKWKAS